MKEEGAKENLEAIQTYTSMTGVIMIIIIILLFLIIIVIIIVIVIIQN